MIREVSPEKRRAIIAEKLNNFVLNYADVKKFDEIMQNRPMVVTRAFNGEKTISIDIEK